MKLLQYIEENDKIVGWSTSDTIGMEIDGKPTKSRWVEVNGDIKGYFKKPSDYQIKKEKVKDKDKKEKEVYNFNKKSKK